MFSVHQSHFRQTGWETCFALRILKSHKVEPKQSSTDYPAQPAHLEHEETNVAFLFGFLNQNFPLDLPFSFLPLFLPVFSWPLLMEDFLIQFGFSREVSEK